jgi:hypothetical protein
LDAGMGWELSMRDPTLLIGPRELTAPGAEGLAAFAGCEASAKQTTTAAVKAHLTTRIYAPLPAARLTGSFARSSSIAESRASSNAHRWRVKGGLIRLMASGHRSYQWIPGRPRRKYSTRRAES